MAPDAAGAMRKIPEDARIEPGWALARFGDGGWWPAIERGLRAGSFDHEVAVGLADVLRSTGTPVAWITTVPSVRLGDLIARLGGDCQFLGKLSDDGFGKQLRSTLEQAGVVRAPVARLS